MVPKRKSRARRTLPLFAAAMDRQTPAQELARLGERPEVVRTGVRSLDLKLEGGVEVGGLTLVVERPDSGALELLLRAALVNAKRNSHVAVVSDRRDEQEIHRRLCAVEAQVDGLRFSSGLVSAEDRLAIAEARKRVPWTRFAIVVGSSIDAKELRELLFTYRPLLLVADLRPRAPNALRPERLDSYREGVTRLASLARRHQTAVVLLDSVRSARHAPGVNDIPGKTSVAEIARTVVTASPSGAGLDLEIARHRGEWLETPRCLRVRSR